METLIMERKKFSRSKKKFKKDEKKKGSCYVCRKTIHFVNRCRYCKGQKIKSETNVIENDMVAIITKLLIVNIIDSRSKSYSPP